MGFWDSVGQVAKGAMNQVEAFNAEVNELSSSYSSRDDDYLKRKIQTGTTAEKAAAAKILKTRQ